MTFLNFSQLPESVFRQIFQKNTFLETKLNFSLTGKYFPLTNFLMTNKYKKKFKNYFLKIIFQKTNMSQKKLLMGWGYCIFLSKSF